MAPSVGYIKKGHTILETTTKLLELYLWRAEKGLAQLPMTGLPEKAEEGLTRPTGLPEKGTLPGVQAMGPRAHIDQ